MWGGATGSKGFGLFREPQSRRAAEWRAAFQEQETGGREAPVESGVRTEGVRTEGSSAGRGRFAFLQDSVLWRGK